MFFHLILTNECNLQCRYCYGEALEDVDTDFSGLEVDYSLPRKISYDIDELKEFCSRDSGCILSFYGGEPLLCIEEIKRIMDEIKAKYFLIQTNGLLLDHLEPEYVNRFHTILVSLDGDETLTDFYRGKGTFRKVVNNLRLIKNNGFEGELIARMTVMEQTDIYRHVRWLLNNSEFSFSSVHWQLNAGFWQNDFKRRNFKEWSQNSYNPGIRRLAKFWVDYMEKNGTVLKLFPFLGIAQSLLSGEEKNLLRCGGGWINYAVQTDGFIVPCPTMWGMKDYYLGHISTAEPLRLKKIPLNEPCIECDIFNICGGRCLYANVTKRWNAEAYRLVCNTVRNLVNVVTDELPRIKQLIDDRKIDLKCFGFLKYNGCEIIP
jgi:putative peptide-modifying radical SAM enzyme